jgi:hypothetical protein
VAKTRALYQLKVTLQDIHPPIWRRIQVWEDTTLAQLHTILQIVMGWEDCHLHQFVIGRRLYSVPDPDDDMYERKVIDESRVPLGEVVPRVGTQFAYLYDFGDLRRSPRVTPWCSPEVTHFGKRQRDARVMMGTQPLRDRCQIGMTCRVRS